jgi:hypothetical protein
MLKRFGAQAPRLRRVIRQKRNPPEHQYFGKCIIEPRSPHSSTGTARGLLRRRVKAKKIILTLGHIVSHNKKIVIRTDKSKNHRRLSNYTVVLSGKKRLTLSEICYPTKSDFRQARPLQEVAFAFMLWEDEFWA